MTKKILPGLFVCSLISIPAYFLGKLFPLLGGAVMGILFGLILGGSLRKYEILREGIHFSGHDVLKLSVIFLGFGLNLGVVAKTGLNSLPIIFSVILTSILVTKFLSKPMGIDDEVGTLIGVGTAICGVSAIAATAPVIKAEDKFVSQSISVIMIFDVMAILIFPVLFNALGFSDESFAILTGATIHNTSSVAATASAWDAIRGSSILGTTTIVKLTRTVGILPITLLFSIINGKKEDGGKEINLLKNIPQFIILFLIASLITTISTSFFNISTDSFQIFGDITKILIIISMVGIGINTDLTELLKQGKKAILLGLICWIAICLVCILVLKLTGTL